MIALYLRLSLADGDLGNDGKDESNSIESQRAILWDYIHQRDDISGEVEEYIDDGYSGTNFNRPAFQTMLEDMKKGKIVTMLTKDLSRLGRNYIEVGDYIEQIFPMLGVRYIAVNSNYDSNEYLGFTGGLDMSFMNLVNTLYSKDLSKKWRSSVETKWKNGISTSGRMPLGYIRDPDTKGKWAIEPYAYDIVRKIYDLVNEDMNMAEIVDQLNRDHIPTPGQYREIIGHVKETRRKVSDEEWLWDKVMLRRVLQTYEYTGALVQSKMRTITVGSGSRRTVPESERFITEDHHEPIVTMEEFEKGRSLIRSMKKGPVVKNRNYPLADVIYCGNCRLRMEYSETAAGAYLKCKHKDQAGEASKCRPTKYERDKIDSLVRNALRRQMFQLEMLDVKLTCSQKIREDDVNHIIEKLDKSMKSLQLKKTRFYEQYAEGAMSKEEYLVKRDSVKRDIQKLMNKRVAALQPLSAKTEIHQDAERYINLEKLRNKESSLSREEVDVFIDKVYIYDEEHIEVQFKFDDLINQMLREEEEGRFS